MLTENQITQIRSQTEKSQNPLFFFDNDADGLCAFLILQRFIGRGKGVPIKSFPELNEDYIRKINELNPDCIFILDKASVSEDFLNKINQMNIPIVWIDHHESDSEKIPEFVSYYNPLLNKDKENVPTTFLCYQVSKKKNDLWLAVIGSISDRFYPEFYKELMKDFPDICIDSENASDIFYKSQIGKIAKLFSFALKDKTTNVINMMKFLMKVKTPYELLEQTKENYTMHKRFSQIDMKYQKLLGKAKRTKIENNVLFFRYGGDLSISSDLSNELSYLFPDKVIAVAYLSGAKANISVRGKNIRPLVLKAIENLEFSRGGGHENAVGAQVRIDDLEKFKENLEKMME